MLFSDTIIVREITLGDTFVSYYSHDGKNNFDVIMENVDRAMGPKKDKPLEKKPEKKDDSQGKKVIIERFRISGTKVKLMKSDLMPALPIPTIELTDIGKKSEGVTLEEAWAQISAAVMKSVGAIGDGLGSLGGILGDGAKDITKALDGGAKELTSALDGVSEKAEDSLNAIKDSGMDAASGVLNVTKDVSSGAAKTTEKAVGAIGSVTEKTVETVGDAAKGTLDAVGDTTKKATEGVKNLFKGFGK